MAFRRHAYLTTVEFMGSTIGSSVDRYALKGAHHTFEKKCFIKVLSEAKRTCTMVETSSPCPCTLAAHPPINTLDDVIPLDAVHFLTKAVHAFALHTNAFTLMERICNLITDSQVSGVLIWAVWRIIFKEQKKHELSEKARERLQQSYIKLFALLEHQRHVVLKALTNIAIYATLDAISALCPTDAFIDRGKKAPCQGFIVYVYQQINFDLTGLVVQQHTVRAMLENSISFAWDEEMGYDWPSLFTRSTAYTTTIFSPMVSKLQGTSHLRTKMDPGRKLQSFALIQHPQLTRSDAARLRKIPSRYQMSRTLSIVREP